MMSTREQMLRIRGVDTASTDQGFYDPTLRLPVVFTILPLASGKIEVVEGYIPPEGLRSTAGYVATKPGSKPVRVCPDCAGGAAVRAGKRCKRCKGEGVQRPRGSSYVTAKQAEELTRHPERVL